MVKTYTPQFGGVWNTHLTEDKRRWAYARLTTLLPKRF